MATGAETALISVAGSLLRKPFEDFYNSCADGVKAFANIWMAAGAVDRITQAVEDLERIRTIVSRQVSTLSEIYYPARLLCKKQVLPAQRISDISESKNVLITGTAGQGKSVLMRYLAVQELRQGRRIPLFIELRRIDSATDLNLLLRMQLNLLADSSHDELLKHLLKRGNVVLLLDGFDEVPREFALSVRDQIFELVAHFKKIQLVISSRPGALCAHLQDLPNLLPVEVAELDESEFELFLKKIGTDDRVRQRLIAAIHSSSTQVKQLLKTPLMLTLLVLTCGGKQQIPDTLHEFYDSLFRVLALMHDETKPGYVREMATKLSYSELEQVFECFAFVSREKFDKTSLNPSQFDESVRAALTYTNKVCTSEGFKTDVSETVCLMAKEGVDTTFIHKSIQEYYTARFIKSLPDDDTAKQAYNSITDMRLLGWASELRFLEQIDPIRYRMFFRKKQIEIFLKICAYSPRNRKIITKNALKQSLAYFEVIKHGANYRIAWSEYGLKKLDSILFFDIAVGIGIVLNRMAALPTPISNNILKFVTENPSLLLEVQKIFANRIEAALAELEEIADTESKRKNALLNILNRALVSQS